MTFRYIPHIGADSRSVASLLALLVVGIEVAPLRAPMAAPLRSTEPRQVYNGAPPLAELVAEDGTTWLEYRKTLVPHYAQAWRDTGLSYLMLFGGFAVQVWTNLRWFPAHVARAGVILGPFLRHVFSHARAGSPAAMLAAPVAALWLGFWLHALNQFGHEGSHGNLLRNRKWNDRLTDWLLWPLFAQSVRSYRKSHMQHHVHLGDHLDTEINYHECMSPWFLIKGLAGIQLVMMLVRYLVKPKLLDGGPNQNSFATPGERMLALSRTALVHGLFIAVPVYFGLYGAAMAWLLAVAATYPCIGTARQILEHRAYAAPCSMDFTQVEHGPVNRLFGDDWFSRCFGAAGLNRHLLHHWDPGISYTRLAEMEAFLMRTRCAAEIERNRSTYFSAAWRLLQTGLRPLASATAPSQNVL